MYIFSLLDISLYKCIIPNGKVLVVKRFITTPFHGVVTGSIPVEDAKISCQNGRINGRRLPSLYLA